MDQTLTSVSIGLPVFNGEDYLGQALDSLLAQTYPNFELIISDNASTDRTPEICRDYANRDKRIKYSRNATNLGGAYNDNNVFCLSSGEYFKWAGHDDLWDSEVLARCVSVLEREPSVVLCYPKTVIIDQEGRVVERYEDDFNLMSPKPHERYRRVIGKKQLLNPFYGLIRSCALRRTRLVESYEASDRVLLGELSLLGKFSEIPEYLFYRRIHPKRATTVNKTPEEKAIWFDPSLRGKILAPRTRRFLGFLTAIPRAKMSPKDTVLCYAEFMRHYFSPKNSFARFGGLMGDMNQAFGAILTHRSIP